MDENAVNIIRESTRNLLKLNRQMHRDEETNIRRSIHEKRISSEHMSEIANKLKTKSSISVTDLQTLKNGLMEDTRYIEIVLNVHGALRGIIRELTGHNINKQCAAAGCLCNLSLGDSKACSAVAKAAGSYLITGLDNFTTELAVTCAWTLGNLAGSGSKVCDILISQGALSKLSDVHTNEDLQDAALYALVHFTYSMGDELRQDHLTKIIETVSKLEITTSSAQLLFILSCHNNFLENISEGLVQKILETFLHIDNKETDKLLYVIRVLANMTCYNVILDYLIVNNVNFKVLLSIDSVSECLFWFLGNLYNYCDRKELFFKLIS